MTYLNMRTSHIKNNFSFQKRNNQVRKADKFQRELKRQIPMSSSTISYLNSVPKMGMDEFGYLTTTKAIWANDICIRLHNQIDCKRQPYLYELSTPEAILKIIRTAKKDKIGDCLETSHLLLGMLIANGYHNSAVVAPYIETVAINERMGVKKILKTPIDHELVLSKIDGKEVMIDPLLNITEGLSGYNKMFESSCYALKIKESRKNGIMELNQKYPFFMQDEDTKIQSQRIYYYFPDEKQLNAQEKQELAEKIAEEFPELILDDLKKQ